LDISIFEVIGPVMVGPSSSHTAGAARLARIARLITGGSVAHVSFGLHGSFAKTCRGHGTDRALVAGALGLFEDDERIADSFSLAKSAGLNYDFYEADLDGMHANSVRFTFTETDGEKHEIVGSSIGGGRIVITRIDGFATEFYARSSALIISQHDKPGMVTSVSAVLSSNDINIGTMKLSRRAKGGVACCIIETDDRIPGAVVDQLRRLPHILSVRAVNLEEGNGSDV